MTNLGGGEFGRLKAVVVKGPREAFRSGEAIAREWRDLAFTHAPDFERALADHERFVSILTSGGADVLTLPAAPGAGLDSLYARDASVLAPQGVVLCRMGKAQRRAEPDAQRFAFESWGLPVAGAI
ncbi:MAG TPA: hypothetical protein VFV78_13285, partial [Vicinamibacterales bacterium]|nr:hypothetical protein [Vicinamibacterales bacterium]